MFGLTCSPSLLSMTVRHHAVCHHVLKYFDLDENLIMKFLNDLCMNDSISGSDSSEKCFEFYLRMKTTLKEGNFNLRKRISNCAEIMEKINSFEEQEFSEKIVDLDKFHKVLGIFWNFEIDQLFFDLKNFVSESQISTKCEFLKLVFCVWSFRRRLSNNYNSKNIVSKDLYDENKWDDALPETIIAEWQNILENVNVMDFLKLERHETI